MTSEVFHDSAWRFLRTMFAIAWSAFAHPFSTTVIDLTTGEMRHESGEDERRHGQGANPSVAVSPMFKLLLLINSALCVVTLGVMIWIAGAAIEPMPECRNGS